MPLTLSVSSFQVPPAPLTSAWPPSLPSVPTSRATRVTSAVNAPSCSTMALTVLAARRNSPWSGLPSASSATLCVRSPLATAPTTRAISRVGVVRSVRRRLRQSFWAAHAPSTRPMLMRWPILPSLPTTLLARSDSLARRSFSSMMSLKTSAIFPLRPTQSSGRREAKLPCLTAVRTWSSSFVSKRSPGAAGDFSGGIILI